MILRITYRLPFLDVKYGWDHKNVIGVDFYDKTVQKFTWEVFFIYYKPGEEMLEVFPPSEYFNL